MKRKSLLGVGKVLCSIGTILTVLLVMLATLVYFSVDWMFQTWNNLTMDELVFHMTAPLVGTNEGMIKEYLNICVVPAILLLGTVSILFLACRKQKKYFIIMGMGIVSSVFILVTSVLTVWSGLDVGNYVKNQGTYSSFIDDYYVDPLEVEITFPKQKKNLIYIFLESMEITYADQENGGAFNENLIPELSELAYENEDFSGEDDNLNGGYSMPGTTWTIGAMFAQTSGLPLNISISSNHMDTQENFFPEIVVLGDILEKEGYSQTLLIGSEAEFGGRELYFTEHGNYDIVDYVYASEHDMLPEDYRVWWGYEDQKLFEFAKDKLVELAGQDAPFNLTLLTVDTHFQEGYLCEKCPDKSDDQYANVMSCSSEQVSSFIEWVQEQKFYEDTVIILAGDHPTMNGEFCEDIDNNYIRKVYTAFINAKAEKQTEMKRNYTTFDMFPTTLAALGVKIEGERLGLGTNLFSAMQTLTERIDIDTEEKELEKKSKFMERLADIDENSEELLRRQGKLPTADVFVDTYDYVTGVLPIQVMNIENVSGTIEKVFIDVWTDEEKSDIQRLELEEQETAVYGIGVSVPQFGYKIGEYYIQVSAINDKGEEYVIGEATGVVN